MRNDYQTCMVYVLGFCMYLSLVVRARKQVNISHTSKNPKERRRFLQKQRLQAFSILSVFSMSPHKIVAIRVAPSDVSWTLDNFVLVAIDVWPTDRIYMKFHLFLEKKEKKKKPSLINIMLIMSKINMMLLISNT